MTKININGKDYDVEIVSFSAKLTNKSISMRGISLAQGYLAIADNYRIYNTISGEPLLRCKFVSFDDCYIFAQRIEKMYWDYFDIWKAYPKADIISWCKYSVNDGAVLFETCQILDNLEIVTNQDIVKANEQANKLAERWRIKI